MTDTAEPVLDENGETVIPEPDDIDQEALARPQQFHKMMRDEMPVMAIESTIMDATIVFLSLIHI